eukprot:g44727.t1
MVASLLLYGCSGYRPPDTHLVRVCAPVHIKPENKECKLEKLDISSNSIALEVNKTLKALTLDGNEIGDEGATYISSALKMNTSLRELYMQNNNIGAEGARAFGEALKVNQTLTSLYLWDNKIGDEGAAHIAAAVKENKECKLEELDISSNSIGAKGALHIAKALEVNQSIEQIWIQGHWIPVASFRDGKTTNIDLSRKNYGDLDAIIIASLLKDHPSVTSVDLRDNNLSVESGSALAAVAKQNPRIKKMCGIPLDSLRDNIQRVCETCSPLASAIAPVSPRFLFRKSSESPL